MSQTTANNITKTIQTPHGYEIRVSDSSALDGTVLSEMYAVNQITVVKAANKVSFAKCTFEK